MLLAFNTERRRREFARESSQNFAAVDQMEPDFELHSFVPTKKYHNKENRVTNDFVRNNRSLVHTHLNLNESYKLFQSRILHMAASGFINSVPCTADRLNFREENNYLQEASKKNKSEIGKNIKSAPKKADERKTTPYFLVHLHNNENSVSLWVRRRDLYVLGFRSKKNWYEYQTPYYEIPDSIVLRFKPNYGEGTSDNKGESYNIKYGGMLLNDSINHLSNCVSTRSSTHLTETREHLIRLIFVLIEACRFEDIYKKVEEVFENEEAEQRIGLDHLKLCKNWEKLSKLVQLGRQLEGVEKLRIVLSPLRT